MPSTSARKKARRAFAAQPPTGVAGTAAGDGSCVELTHAEDSTTVRLAGGQSFVLQGFATLTVVRGGVWIAGRSVSVGDASLPLDVGYWASVEVEAVGPPVQVPQVVGHGGAGQVEVTLRSAGTPLPGHARRSFRLGDDTAGAAPAPVFPPAWREAAEAVAAGGGAGGPLVVAVVGPKGAGKSTCVRLLLNRLLDESPAVGYIDTDLGQPELSPPGLVSVSLVRRPLLGGPLVEQRPSWERAAFLGDVSPAADPAAYTAAVGRLMEWARHGGLGGPLPLVVNTHGWVKGLGLDLLATLLAEADPTHVVQLDSGNANRDLPAGHWWALPESAAEWQGAASVAAAAAAGGAQLFAIPSASRAAQISGGAAGTDATGKSLVDGRNARWGVWAHLCATASQGAPQPPGQRPWLQPEYADGDSRLLSAAASVLAETPPYCVPLSALPLRFLHSPVAPGEEYVAANAALVGLAGAADESGARPCLGVALLRSLDLDAGVAHLLTPAPRGCLGGVEELQVGSLELPPQLLASERFISPYAAPFCLPAEGTGAGRTRARNNLKRAAHHRPATPGG
eukprot:jgi/Tetstr1/435651/TSEL_024551.t1